MQAVKTDTTAIIDEVRDFMVNVPGNLGLVVVVVVEKWKKDVDQMCRLADLSDR